MREIKFRGWDGEKMMLFDLTYGLDCGYIYKGDESMDIGDGAIVMQYIGRKDKNGKEIYEGDILSDGAIVKWFDSLTWDSGGSSHPGFYCEKWLECGEDLDYHSSFNDVEIVGNIYEMQS